MIVVESDVGEQFYPNLFESEEALEVDNEKQLLYLVQKLDVYLEILLQRQVPNNQRFARDAPGFNCAWKPVLFDLPSLNKNLKTPLCGANE
mmetsp:Transcript_44585/g.45225  ORF Transcript_44585/g.45225 Transcript_44585/m.45225 type:complete len:91 (-) Transcript_44585:447-719(-)